MDLWNIFRWAVWYKQLELLGDTYYISLNACNVFEQYLSTYMSNKGLLAAHWPCIHALQYELILYGLFMYKIQYILSWVDPIWTKEWLTLMSIYRMCKTTGEHNSWENEDIGLFVDSHFVVETRRSLESHDLAKMMRMCTCGLKSSLRGSLPLMEDLSTLSSLYIHKLSCNYTVACITFWKSFQKKLKYYQCS